MAVKNFCRMKKYRGICVLLILFMGNPSFCKKKIYFEKNNKYLSFFQKTRFHIRGMLLDIIHRVTHFEWPDIAAFILEGDQNAIAMCIEKHPFLKDPILFQDFLLKILTYKGNTALIDRYLFSKLEEIDEENNIFSYLNEKENREKIECEVSFQVLERLIKQSLKKLSQEESIFTDCLIFFETRKFYLLKNLTAKGLEILNEDKSIFANPLIYFDKEKLHFLKVTHFMDDIEKLRHITLQHLITPCSLKKRLKLNSFIQNLDEDFNKIKRRIFRKIYQVGLCFVLIEKSQNKNHNNETFIISFFKKLIERKILNFNKNSSMFKKIFSKFIKSPECQIEYRKQNKKINFLLTDLIIKEDANKLTSYIKEDYYMNYIAEEICEHYFKSLFKDELVKINLNKNYRIKNMQKILTR